MCFHNIKVKKVKNPKNDLRFQTNIIIVYFERHGSHFRQIILNVQLY